jgi:hypothetical protein
LPFSPAGRPYGGSVSENKKNLLTAVPRIGPEDGGHLYKEQFLWFTV